MDYLIYALFALAGGLVSYIFISKGLGPFEKLIWASLYEGRRVVVSIEDEAFIFELNGDRLRITRGTSEYMDGDGYDTLPFGVDIVGSGQSDDSNTIDVSDTKDREIH